MINVVIPDSEHRRLPFFLAAEEWVARNLAPDDYFFAWRVNPTVICGRHQEIDKEVDLCYCREAGIDVVRRRSGGGTVFADRNNWMFSYITPGDAVTTTFARYTTMIADTLRAMDFNAEPTGRNDILVDGAKVAGNAFYHLPGRCIVHGTMLLDIDMAHMSRAITPSRAKLESKGVKSVASRVTSLRACGLTMSVEDFGAKVTAGLCDRSITLTPNDLRQIEELEKRYYAPEFMRIGAPGSTISKRIEGVGTVAVALTTDASGTIEDLSLTGDFFADADALKAMTAGLRGLKREAVAEAIRAHGSPITGLDPESLAELITEQK